MVLCDTQLLKLLLKYQLYKVKPKSKYMDFSIHVGKKSFYISNNNKN